MKGYVAVVHCMGNPPIGSQIQVILISICGVLFSNVYPLSVVVAWLIDDKCLPCLLHMVWLYLQIPSMV